MNFRKKLLNTRENLGYSQKDFAEYLGLSRTSYNRYERGLRPIPEEKIIEIKNALKILNHAIPQQKKLSKTDLVIDIITGIVFICVIILIFCGE